MASILMAFIMGVLGGPVIALAMNAPAPKRSYEQRKAKFLAGNGPDPDKAPFGPHKPFAQNAILMGLIFGAIGFFVGSLA